jgi:hypothetical protein
MNHSEKTSGEPGKKRKRLSPLRKQGFELEASLRSYIQAVYTEQYGYTALISDPYSLILQLQAIPGKNGVGFQVDVPLYEQVRRALADAAAAAGAYQDGHIYCYLCESSFCSHSYPSDTLTVFNGYHANGKPAWQDFLSVLIEQKVDTAGLFDREDSVACHFIRGRDLKRFLMHGFGKSSKTYDLLGQVIIGYAVLPESMSSEVSREMVLTVQAVESRYPTGAVRLSLNLIAGLPDTIAVSDILANEKNRPIQRGIEKARRQLKDLEHNLQAVNRSDAHAERSKLFQQVPGILKQIVRIVTFQTRQSDRRTHHVYKRVSDNRPVSRAHEDAKHAHGTEIFRDLHRQTYIVQGPRQRIHVFTSGGIHVTSLKMQQDQVQKRLSRNRWKVASPNEVSAFRSHFKQA